ncbi:hypothetical protein LXL04_032359 [Taraxacum kok-saghyz]
MQFYKLLKKLIDEMFPDWRDKFLSYKDLKKLLKRVYSRDGRCNKRMKLSSGDAIETMAEEKEVVDFVKLCQEQTDKLNDFVLEKQEWYIIKVEVLEGNLIAAKDSRQELMKVARDLADLHGEIILLLNYSALNYTGLVKILKKHDKLSGALVRVPFIQKVLNEPFYKTDVLNNLVKKCEMMLDKISPMKEQTSSTSESIIMNEGRSSETLTEPNESSSVRVPDDLVEIENRENKYLKLTLSALTVLAEIRGGSSTINMFSLPPMQQSKEMAEIWKKTSVVEEVAKAMGSG